MGSILALFLFLFWIGQNLYTHTMQLNSNGVLTNSIALSYDGSIMVISYQNASTNVYKRDNGTYKFNQEIIVDGLAICISNDQSLMIISNSIEVWYFENINNEFILSFKQPIADITKIKINKQKTEIIMSGVNNFLNSYSFNGNQTFLQYQFADINDQILQFKWNDSETELFCGGFQNIIRIYSKNSDSSYTLTNSFNFVGNIGQLDASTDLSTIFISQNFPPIYFYSNNNIGLTIDSQVSFIFAGKIGNQRLCIGGMSNIIEIYQLINKTLSLNLTLLSGSFVFELVISPDDSTIIIGTDIGVQIHYQCSLKNCQQCSGIYLCSQCSSGFTLQQSGLCVSIQNTEILQVQNELQCPLFSTLSSQNQCVISQQPALIGQVITKIVSIVRYYKMKSILILTGDMFLYQYHQYNYTGTLRSVFELSRIIQMQKNKIFPIDNFLKDIQNQVNKYHIIANQKYKTVQDKEDSIPQNISSYLIQIVPISILFYILTNLIFKLLFNHKISIIFRPYSFSGFIFVSLFQAYLQQFVYLGFRNVHNFVLTVFLDKIYTVFSVIVLFIFITYALCSYFLFSEFYGRFFRYFLCNLYRIKGSAFIMMSIYCLRPALQGLTHSILYKYWEYQLFILGLIDLLLFLTLSYYQIIYDIFVSKTSFMFLQIYFACGIFINILLYINIKFQGHSEILQIQDKGALIFLYIRFFSLVASAICDIINGINCLSCKSEQKQQQKNAGQVEQNKNQKQNKNTNRFNVLVVQNVA